MVLAFLMISSIAMLFVLELLWPTLLRGGIQRGTTHSMLTSPLLFALACLAACYILCYNELQQQLIA